MWKSIFVYYGPKNYDSDLEDSDSELEDYDSELEDFDSELEPYKEYHLEKQQLIAYSIGVLLLLYTVLTLFALLFVIYFSK
jgi:hypothetical protein